MAHIFPLRPSLLLCIRLGEFSSKLFRLEIAQLCIKFYCHSQQVLLDASRSTLPFSMDIILYFIFYLLVPTGGFKYFVSPSLDRRLFVFYFRFFFLLEFYDRRFDSSCCTFASCNERLSYLKLKVSREFPPQLNQMKCVLFETSRLRLGRRWSFFGSHANSVDETTNVVVIDEEQKFHILTI